MSAQYDIFDNLNSYLDKTNDCDVPDDADLGASFDEAEIDMGTSQAKTVPKRKPSVLDTKLTSPKKKRKRENAGRQRSSQDSSGDSDDDEDGVSSVSSLTYQSSQSSVPGVVHVVEDDFSEQVNSLQQQYNLIFNRDPSFTVANKRYFDGLKRQYNALIKQHSSIATARSARRNSFPQKLQLLRDVFYDICVNYNLMAPSVQPQASSNSTRSTGTRRTRRSQVPEIINLVDSPALILPGVVNLDSDDDSGEVAVNNLNSNLSFDSDNYEMSLKVKWGGKIERFPHRKFQPFADLIELLAKRERADPSRVILDVNERIIKPEDTPDSIGYRISQFISGRVLEGALADVFIGGHKQKKASSSAVSRKNTNLITLRVQSDRWKHPLEIQLEKDRKLKLLVIKCAEQLKCSPGEIRLSFDGDTLDMDATPADLELEGGEILDLRFVK